MENYNFIFLDSRAKGISLLGRTVAEHMAQGLGLDIEALAPADMALEGEGVVFEEKWLVGLFKRECVNVVLTLDMPLVRAEDIKRYAGTLRRKRASSMRLSKNGLSRICVYPYEDSGIFAADECFLQIVDAKSESMVYNLLKERITERHLEGGAHIPDAGSVTIDDTVIIEEGARILPFTRLEGDLVLERGASISASYISGGRICEGASVEMSHIVNSRVGRFATVGPFARLRGADIGERSRIGDFVEVKASTLYGQVKAAHLAYIGDAEVGCGTNIGCGTVFCNYDGKTKHKTAVGEGCFIGANSNLVAPLNIADNAYIAAGTTVTEDVGAGEFVIGRMRQTAKNRVKKE